VTEEFVVRTVFGGAGVGLMAALSGAGVFWVGCVAPSCCKNANPPANAEDAFPAAFSGCLGLMSESPQTDAGGPLEWMLVDAG